MAPRDSQMSLSKFNRSVGTARTVAAVVNAATALRLSPPLKRVAHIVYFGSPNRKRSTLLSVQARGDPTLLDNRSNLGLQLVPVKASSVFGKWGGGNE